MMMDELLNMGFPSDLAAQALAFTGGKSILEATEWILNPSRSCNPHYTNPNLTPTPSSHQPKLDRFFQSQSHQSTDKPSKRVTAAPISILTNMDNSSNSEESNPKRLKVSDKQMKAKNPHEPLSERMRPSSIDDVVGQEHLLGKGCMIRSAMECNRLPSLLFWGPPGTGKTSIVKAIFSSLNSSAAGSDLKYQFVSLSAVTCGVKDVREAVESAKKMRIRSNKRTILFIDEVHRFNKSQQDSFLPIIEDGSIVFMGATTENPSFHLITPLLSRCRVLTLNPLKPEHVILLVNRAVNDLDKGLCCSVGMRVKVCPSAIEFLSKNCDGDARVALNALEISATTAAARLPAKQLGSQEEVEPCESDSVVAFITLDDVKEALQCKHLAYDKAGDEHYNLISALHKSMRGSDANASIYWLARMLEGGEEPLYIARRLIRFASEDVGLADPSALPQAVACYQACHFLGIPECNVILAQCAAYLALAPKSVSVYKAINAAQKVVRDSVGQNEGVPLHLRNAPTRLMKDLGYAKDYLYPPSDPLLAASQTYLPPSIQGYKFLDFEKL
ncbi:unnamed protein product [Rhodiola kirilowii]